MLDTLDRHVRRSRSCSARARRWPISACSASCNPVGRSDADGRDARARAGRLLLAAAARRCLGVEGDWLDPKAPLPETLTALLRHCGETYLPFLAANTRALQERQGEDALDILGRPYARRRSATRASATRLRKKLAALPGEVRRRLDPVLEQTGCLRYLA